MVRMIKNEYFNQKCMKYRAKKGVNSSFCVEGRDNTHSYPKTPRFEPLKMPQIAPKCSKILQNWMQATQDGGLQENGGAHGSTSGLPSARSVSNEKAGGIGGQRGGPSCLGGASEARFGVSVPTVGSKREAERP